jgi:hypothetical protein
MPSADVFNTYSPQKQAEIVTKFMELFRGSERGYGWGDGKGAKLNEKKNKMEYTPGSIGWKWGKPGEREFWEHLSGIRALGIGPLFEDGTTIRGEIDVDKIGIDDKYEFDYAVEMGRITQSKIPLVVCRTKSTGLRIICNFIERIDAEIVRDGMVRIAALLGYAGNEIFPKQSKLAKEDDAPSWTFLPYGPEFGIFAEQCGMNESGNAMDIEIWMSIAEERRISRDEFTRIAFENNRANAETGHAHGANGSNRPKTPKGVWVEQDTYSATVKETFKYGPPCLQYIAMNKCTQYQHNYLFDAGIFLKRKYPDNWASAFAWVNYNVLKPSGDDQKMGALVKDLKNRDYEYRCKDEPICSHCIADACRRMPYGVGNGKVGDDSYELGLTILNRAPRIYYVNMGEKRVAIAPEELVNLKVYRVKSLEYSGHLPELMKQSEWDDVVRRNIENATVVEPPEIYKTNINEIEILEMYLSVQIPSMVRSAGEEFLTGKVGETVRVKEKEEMIYFKWWSLMGWCRRALYLRERDLNKLRLFIIDNGQEYGRTELRDWFRSTLAVSFKLFDEAKVDKWIRPDGG